MLTQEQIAFYHEHGYLGVENVLSENEVNGLRRITDEYVEKSREATEHTEVFDLEPGHTPENPKLRRLKVRSCYMKYIAKPCITRKFWASYRN